MLFIKLINFSFLEKMFCSIFREYLLVFKGEFQKIFHKKYLLRKVNNLIIFFYKIKIFHIILLLFFLCSSRKNWKIIFLSVLLVRFIFDLCYTHPLLNLIKLTKNYFSNHQQKWRGNGLPHHFVQSTVVYREVYGYHQ